MHGIGGFPVREGLEWSVAAGPAAYSRGRLGGREKRLADSFFKLVAAVVAIMAISMLVYTCSPYAPLEKAPPPLEVIQDSGGTPPPSSN